MNDDTGWAAYGSDFDGDVFLDAVSLATVLVHLGVHDALKLVELLLKKNKPVNHSALSHKYVAGILPYKFKE